ncbi:MAG: HAMP domain-containing protein [Chloroflexota bacterium]|nr:HAMP domain-containing protein [Chloroflexota bacterium]
MRITIGVKLGMGFLAMLILTIGMGVAGIVNVVRMAQATNTLAYEAEELRRVLGVEEALVWAEAGLKRAMAIRTAGEIAIAKFSQDELNAEVGSYTREEGRKRELSAAHAEFDELSKTFLDTLSARGTVSEPESTKLDETVKEYTALLTELETDSRERIAVAADSAQSASLSARNLIIVFGVGAILVGIALSVGIARSITRPIVHLVGVTDRISMGDLDTAVEVSSQDEVGDLAESIERMRVSLKAAMERLRKGA